jgi:hypothetical protein
MVKTLPISGVDFQTMLQCFRPFTEAIVNEFFNLLFGIHHGKCGVRNLVGQAGAGAILVGKNC